MHFHKLEELLLSRTVLVPHLRGIKDWEFYPQEIEEFAKQSIIDGTEYRAATKRESLHRHISGAAFPVDVFPPKSDRLCVELARNLLAQSVKFFCGDMKEIPLSNSSFPRLPFSRCSFEYSVNTVPSFFCLAEEEGSLMKLHFLNSDALRVGGVYIGGAEINRLDGTIVHHCIHVGAVQEQIAYISSFLTLLNCVNVASQMVPAPDGLNQRRARHKRGPIYAYHVLVLKRTQKQLALSGSHESPRIHLRRGHIKHRKTGDFWWQPCVVGDPKRGIVMKDYRADKLVH